MVPRISKWVLLIPLFIWGCQLVCQAMPSSGNKYAWHEVNTSYGWNCYVPNCEPGFEPTDCLETDEFSSKCVPCETGKYMPTPTRFALPDHTMPKCKSHARCDSKYQRMSFRGNATHNIVCECTDKDFPVVIGSECYPTCNAGEYRVQGSKSCEKCPDGEFKNVKGEGPCTQCTKCNHTQAQCNSTHDAPPCSPGMAVVSTTVALGAENKLMFVWIIVIVIVLVVVAVIVAIGVRRWRRSTSSSSDAKNPSLLPLSSQNGTRLNGNADAIRNGGVATLHEQNEDAPGRGNVQEEAANGERVDLHPQNGYTPVEDNEQQQSGEEGQDQEDPERMHLLEPNRNNANAEQNYEGSAGVHHRNLAGRNNNTEHITSDNEEEVTPLLSLDNAAANRNNENDSPIDESEVVYKRNDAGTGGNNDASAAIGAATLQLPQDNGPTHPQNVESAAGHQIPQHDIPIQQKGGGQHAGASDYKPPLQGQGAASHASLGSAESGVVNLSSTDDIPKSSLCAEHDESAASGSTTQTASLPDWTAPRVTNTVSPPGSISSPVNSNIVDLRESVPPQDTSTQEVNEIWKYGKVFEDNMLDTQKYILLDDTVLGSLIQDGILTLLQNEDFQRRLKVESKAKCLHALLPLLKAKGNKGFECFIKALVIASQDILAQTLHRELADDFIANRDKDKGTDEMDNPNQTQTKPVSIVRPTMAGSKTSDTEPMVRHPNPNTTVPKELEDDEDDTQLKEPVAGVNENTTVPKVLYDDTDEDTTLVKQ